MRGKALKQEQERTQKLREEIEQMERVTLQLVTATSVSGNMQNVSFSGLGTATTTSTSSTGQKDAQSRPRNTSAKTKEQAQTGNRSSARATASFQALMASARLASSSLSGAHVLPPKVTFNGAKPNPIKSPLPSISSRPASGTVPGQAAGAQVVHSRHVVSKTMQKIDGSKIGGQRSGKNSASNSRVNSRRGSVSEPSEEAAPRKRVSFTSAVASSGSNAAHQPKQAQHHTASEPVSAHSPMQLPSGHVLKLAAQGTGVSSATEFLMREELNFTLGKDIFPKDNVPISTACDMAIGNDVQLDPETLGGSTGVGTDVVTAEVRDNGDTVGAKLGIPSTESSPQQHAMHFEEAHADADIGESSPDTCAAANDNNNPTSYFVQIEKALVLKSLIEASKSQETAEERQERLIKLAMDDILAPIQDIDDDIDAQIVITPADIMSELAQQLK